MFFRILTRVLFAFVFLSVGTTALAFDDQELKYCQIRYDSACFIVNDLFYIDLRNRPEEIIGECKYVKSEWLTSRYYLLTDYPIRLASIRDRLYSVQFVFGQDSSPGLSILIYDLKIEAKTSINDLERYFQVHRIEYSRGNKNIATPFACFYYEDNQLRICEFRVAVFRHYADYFFMNTGDRPWWVEEKY